MYYVLVLTYAWRTKCDFDLQGQGTSVLKLANWHVTNNTSEKLITI